MIIGIGILAIMNYVNMLFYSTEGLAESELFNHSAFLAGKLTSLFTSVFFAASLSTLLFHQPEGRLPVLLIGGIFSIFSLADALMGNYPTLYGALSILICLPSALLRSEAHTSELQSR